LVDNYKKLITPKPFSTSLTKYKHTFRDKKKGRIKIYNYRSICYIIIII